MIECERATAADATSAYAYRKTAASSLVPEYKATWKKPKQSQGKLVELVESTSSDSEQAFDIPLPDFVQVFWFGTLLCHGARSLIGRDNPQRRMLCCISFILGGVFLLYCIPVQSLRIERLHWRHVTMPLPLPCGKTSTRTIVKVLPWSRCPTSTVSLNPRWKHAI